MKRLKEDITVLLQNKIYMILLVLVALGCYGFKLMHPTIGIDDTPYEYYFSEGLIVVVGRWVLFLLNKVLDIGQYAPFLTDFVAVILLLFAAILWSVVFKRIFEKALPDWCYLIFSCLFISNPLISEVFTYFLHNGIGIGYVCSALAVLSYLECIEHPKAILPHILSAVFVWTAIGCYESFAVVFLVMTLFVLLVNRVSGKKQHPILSVLKIGIILIAAILLRSLITKLLIAVFSLQDLTTQAKQRSLTEVLGWIFDAEGRASLNMALKRLFVMYGVFAYQYLPIAMYLLSSLIVAIYSVWKTIRNKDLGISLYMIGIFIASWMLIFIEGKVTLYRSCQFLPLFCASSFLLLFYAGRNLLKKRYVTIATAVISAIFIWNQTADMNNWFYIDYGKYEDAKNTMNNISLELEKHYDTNKPLVFIGIYEPPMSIVQDAYVPLNSDTFFKMNRITQRIDPHLLEKFYRRHHVWVAQTPSLSVIGWGIDAFDNNAELIKFMAMHGHEFIGVDNKELITQMAITYRDIPSWPMEGSIIETEEYIIINFGY